MKWHPDDEKPMDEFQWEKFLKASDARTDQYMRALEKFKDHPDREKLVDREMGWDRPEETEDDRSFGDEPGFEDEFQGDNSPLPEPNPATEGVDWVRSSHGSIHHPLTMRMLEDNVEMARFLDTIGRPQDDVVVEMISESRISGAKLAGALDHLGFDHDKEAGFVVASLKRSLAHLHNALGAAERVAEKKVIPGPKLEKFRKTLLEIRQEILALMDRFRQEI